MKLLNGVLVLLTFVLISCNNRKEEGKTENPEEKNTVITREIKNDTTSDEVVSIINTLQGKWKEEKYPFRVVHFNEMTVKFIEEGIVEPPTFKEYNIMKACPFEVNNITGTNPEDLFLVMSTNRTCEKLRLTDTTLILSGYSVNTKSDYKIVYKKMD